jgi:hypothetical protein
MEEENDNNENDQLIDKAEKIFGESASGPKYIYIPEVTVMNCNGPLQIENQKKIRRQIENEVIDLDFLKKITPEILTEDEGVIKYVVKEGKSSPDIEPIKDGATASIKYEGRKKDGSLLDLFRNPEETRKVKLFNDNYIHGK